jgi:single-strand DNA-binding protein
MPSLNKVMLIGNVTRDPEIKYTPKGTGVLELGLAMNRKYTLESGEQREEVTYVDVTFFGKSAEIIKTYVKKGKQMYVEGRLRLDSWDDKTSGQKVYRLRVAGEEFQFLGSRGDEEGGSSQPRVNYGNRQESSGPPQQPRTAPPSGPAAPPAPDYGEIDGDDIPF